MATEDARVKPWMTYVLCAAAAYNVLWGIVILAYPNIFFGLAALGPPNYILLWQYVGIMVAAYGIGYAFAAKDPLRYWPIILVGLLKKILVPAGFMLSVISNSAHWVYGWIVLASDLVWWIPFALILYKLHRPFKVDKKEEVQPQLSDRLFRELETTRTQHDSSLMELSCFKPLLVVFLRNLGCPFCRQTLDDVAKRRKAIERNGTRIVLVHMSRDSRARRLFAKYGLEDVYRISNRDRRLYKAFGLHRGKMSQVFGTQVWGPALKATLSGHIMGIPVGDALQMPGVFLLYQGKVVRSFYHSMAADRPDYEDFSVCRVSGI